MTNAAGAWVAFLSDVGVGSLEASLRIRASGSGHGQAGGKREGGNIHSIVSPWAHFPAGSKSNFLFDGVATWEKKKRRNRLKK
jgi:hypothetical protein